MPHWVTYLMVGHKVDISSWFFWGNVRFSPFSWQSKRIRRVVRITLAGEALALADGVNSGMFLATLFAELITRKAKPLLLISCVTGNHSLYGAVKSTKFVADKGLRIEISNIKVLIQHRQIKRLQWLATRGQIADSLTKKGTSSFGLLKAISDGMWCSDNSTQEPDWCDGLTIECIIFIKL